MQRYFDAFVYTANWCSCRLSLRVPLDTFASAALKSFAARGLLTCKATKTHWILDCLLDQSENHERFAMDDGSGWMRRLLPLRVELLSGDLRPLYLGWLAAAWTGSANSSRTATAPDDGLDACLKMRRAEPTAPAA
jgi:hypothetical protein